MNIWIYSIKRFHDSKSNIQLFLYIAKLVDFAIFILGQKIYWKFLCLAYTYFLSQLQRNNLILLFFLLCYCFSADNESCFGDAYTSYSWTRWERCIYCVWRCWCGACMNILLGFFFVFLNVLSAWTIFLVVIFTSIFFQVTSVFYSRVSLLLISYW